MKQLQCALKEHGYHPGTIDGSYGSHTVAAVNAFQIDAGLVPDGEAGSQTLKALGIALPK